MNKENMEETRVSKYQNYRSSIIKEGATLSKPRARTASSFNTTSTLPINQVIDQINEENEEVAFLKKKFKRKYLSIAILIVAGVIALAVIAIVAIILFRR